MMQLGFGRERPNVGEDHAVQLIDETERPALLEFLAATPDFPQQLAYLYRRTGGRDHCFMAWHDDQVVGMLSGSFTSAFTGNRAFESFTLPPSPHAFLERIHVSESERGRGVGTSLVRAYAEEASGRGCTFIGGSIDLSSDSSARRAFFEELGFEIRAHDNFGATVDTILAATTACRPR